MATDEPIGPRDSQKIRWSDVWREGDNLFELVERELESPLPRDLEIPSNVSAKSQNYLVRLMWGADLYPSYLWCDLEGIDADVCARAYNVGPSTILRLVAELAAVARNREHTEVDDEPSISDAEIRSKLPGVVVDSVVYAIYGGSEGGFRRLWRDVRPEDLSNGDGDPAALTRLLNSTLQESKRVVRNMLSSVQECGHIVSSEEAIRWIWNEGELASLLETQCASAANLRMDPLSDFQKAVPMLRERLSNGKSIEEIAKDIRSNKVSVRHKILMWLHYVPADLCVAF